MGVRSFRARSGGSLRAAGSKTLSYPPKLARSDAADANGSVWKSTASAKAPGWAQKRLV